MVSTRPPTCSTVFSIPEQGRGAYPSFHILSVLLHGQPGQQSIIIIIIIIIITSLEFFTSVLADGLSLEFE